MNDQKAVWSRLPTAVLAVLSACLLVGPTALAVPVDAELVLLVDVTQSVSDNEFDGMMASFASGFESAGVVDAIQSGTIGSLAVSLVFYTHRNRQEVGVDWMLISDANSAAAFSLALQNVVRPLSQPRTGIAGAIDFAVASFGDETGGAGNGYESATQGILLVGDGIDDHSPRTNGSREVTVQNARDGALASGVDVIGALTVGAAGSVDSYFAQNVVGGPVGNVPGGVHNSADFAALNASMQSQLQGFVMVLIPEPELGVLGLAAAILLVRRRRPLKDGRNE